MSGHLERLNVQSSVPWGDYIYVEGNKAWSRYTGLPHGGDGYAAHNQPAPPGLRQLLWESVLQEIGRALYVKWLAQEPFDPRLLMMQACLDEVRRLNAMGGNDALPITVEELAQLRKWRFYHQPYDPDAQRD